MDRYRQKRTLTNHRPPDPCFLKAAISRPSGKAKYAAEYFRLREVFL